MQGMALELHLQCRGCFLQSICCQGGCRSICPVSMPYVGAAKFGVRISTVQPYTSHIPAQSSCCACVLAHGTGRFMLAAGAPASACVMKDQWPFPPGFDSLCPMSLSLAPQTGEVTCATCYNVMRMLAAATGAWHCRLNMWWHSILLCLNLDELPMYF